MAYAAATSLYNAIDLLVDSSRISVDDSTREILSDAQEAARALIMTLYKYNTFKISSQGVMAVEATVRDETRKLEDQIETHASAQFLSQSHIHNRNHSTLSLKLDHLRHDVDCFVQLAKKLREEYEEELYKPPPPAALTIDVLSSDSGGPDCDDMIGLSDLFLEIRDRIVGDYNTVDHVNVVAITGMVGTGKTALVKKLYNDSLVKEKFQYRAFVRVGPIYQFDEILRAIIAQIDVDGELEMMMEDGKNISYCLRKSLWCRRYLIVLDDVWHKDFGDYFTIYLRGAGVKHGNILVTSRIDQIFYDEYSKTYYHHRMRLLNDEESWEFLQRKVFGDEEDGDYRCPPLLVKAGKKIAKNCEGLPLLILTVAKLLFEAPKTLEYWKEVAEMKNSIFEDAMDQMYEVLLPSYNHLDQNVKACFLYMYAFPKNCAVRRSRINNLWHTEKFASGIELIIGDMVENNIVVIRQKRLNVVHEAKACSLHVVYRHLSKRVGKSNKFLHILNRYEDERIKEERHLAIYHNSLLAIKEVYTSIPLFSSVRSILCTGSYHQYQVPVCLELKLLKVLDALSIRFYEFPVEVVKLLQLRYLSLTTNADLPSSIRKLRFLECLIVHQYLSINHPRVAESSYLPVEIWELQELKHLQIIGRNLPRPPPGATLPKLRELLGVGIQSCAEAILRSLPYIHKLKIISESAPDAAHPINCIDKIRFLTNLSSLTCVVVNPKLLPNSAHATNFVDQIPFLKHISSLLNVVVNPKLLPKSTVPPQRLSISTSGLRKLTLSGFGYPWEDMSKLFRFPYLRVLKLRCYAFRGERWDAKNMRFSSLKYLWIEDTDLMEWTASDKSFRRLRYLTMKNCYKLLEIPLFNDSIKIELVDCNPIAETRAKQKVEANYSWKK